MWAGHVHARGNFKYLQWAGLALVVGALAASGSACKGEAARVKRAYKTVLEHSGASTGGQRVWRQKKLPGFVVAVRENRDVPGRPSLDVDVLIAHPTNPREIRERLDLALRRAKAATALPVVRLQAWPEGLVPLGRVIGRAFLAPDGRGWDGKGNQVRGLAVLGNQKPGLRRPSAFDVQVLRAVVLRWRRLRKRSANSPTAWESLRAGEASVHRALAEAADAMGLTARSVRQCLVNALGYWPAPHWQPSVLLPSQ